MVFIRLFVFSYNARSKSYIRAVYFIYVHYMGLKHLRRPLAPIIPPQRTLDLEYQDELQNLITEIPEMRDLGLFISVPVTILGLQSISRDVTDNVNHPRRLDPTIELITYSFVLYL